MSVRKVCDKLELTFGRCESEAKALLKTEGIEKLTDEQLKDALNCVEEEHHAIIFLYKSDRQKLVMKKQKVPMTTISSSFFSTT